MILSTALEWPTLTVQWLPDKQECAKPPYLFQRLSDNFQDTRQAILNTSPAVGDAHFRRCSELLADCPRATPEPECSFPRRLR